jgi:hypothetical protein
MDGERVKVFRVDLRLALVLMNAAVSREFVQLPVRDSLPADATVVDVRWNWPCRCFDVLVVHQSFELVPGFMEPPVDPEPVTVEELRRSPMSDHGFCEPKVLNQEFQVRQLGKSYSQRLTSMAIDVPAKSPNLWIPDHEAPEVVASARDRHHAEFMALLCGTTARASATWPYVDPVKESPAAEAQHRECSAEGLLSADWDSGGGRDPRGDVAAATALAKRNVGLGPNCLEPPMTMRGGDASTSDLKTPEAELPAEMREGFHPTDWLKG